MRHQEWGVLDLEEDREHRKGDLSSVKEVAMLEKSGMRRSRTTGTLVWEVVRPKSQGLLCRTWRRYHASVESGASVNWDGPPLMPKTSYLQKCGHVEALRLC